MRTNRHCDVHVGHWVHLSILLTLTGNFEMLYTSPTAACNFKVGRNIVHMTNGLGTLIVNCNTSTFSQWIHHPDNYSNYLY